jgi:hypothetical protein
MEIYEQKMISSNKTSNEMAKRNSAAPGKKTVMLHSTPYYVY